MENYDSSENFNPCFDEIIIGNESYAVLNRILNEENPIIFCGAGISFNSGIPLAIKQIKSILESLDCNEEHIQILIPRDSSGNETLSMPFELIMQILLDNLIASKDYSFKNLYSEFIEGSIANPNHYLLSELLLFNKINCVVTTNFDTCIEDAWNILKNKTNSSNSLDVIVPYEFDDETISKIDINGKLIKLHGSINNPQTLGLNMDTVSNTNNTELVKSILEKIFINNKRPIIFIGYSCSDFYDIGEYFENLKYDNVSEIAPIIYFQHGTDIDDLSVNPQIMFDQINTSKVAIIGNLDDAVESINPEYKNLIKFDLKNYQKFQKFRDSIATTKYNNYVLGLLFIESGHLEISKQYLEQCFQDEIFNNDFRNYLGCLLNLGNIYSIFNEHSKAEKNFNDILSTFQNLAMEDQEEFLPNIALTLNNLGILLFNKKDYENAEKKMNEALDIRKKLNKLEPNKHLQDLAMTFNNLGALYNEINHYDKSQFNYFEALEIRRNLSKILPQTFLPEVAKTLTNLGILLMNNNNFEQSETLLLEALELNRTLSKVNFRKYIPEVSWTLSNLGLLYKNNDKYKLAEMHYLESLNLRRELAKEVPEIYMILVARTLNNLAVLYRDNFEFSLAQQYQEESLAIKRRF